MRRKQFNLSSTQQEDAYTTKHAKRHSDAKKSIRMCIANVLAVCLVSLPFCCFCFDPLGSVEGLPRRSSDGPSRTRIHCRQFHRTSHWHRSCHASEHGKFILHGKHRLAIERNWLLGHVAILQLGIKLTKLPLLKSLYGPLQPPFHAYSPPFPRCGPLFNCSSRWEEEKKQKQKALSPFDLTQWTW